MQCDCGYDFPVNSKLTSDSSNRDLIVEETINIYEVDEVIYSRHNKKNKPPSMRVRYIVNSI